MKIHMLMASAAALTFATGAIAQDVAAPATPDATVSGTASGDVAAPDAAASAGAAASTADATTAPSASDAASAAAAPATDAASAAAAPATDAASAAAAPATDAASAAAAPAQTGAADTQSAMNTPAVDPAKAQAADQMIAQNWSKYDEGNKGQLTPLEFGTWVLAAQGNDMTAQVEKSRHSRASNLPSTKVLNATAAEFSKADTNKDRTVSQEELKAYLSA